MKRKIYLILEVLCGFIAVVALIDIVISVSKGVSPGTGVGGVLFWGLMFLLAWNAHKKAVRVASKTQTAPQSADVE